MVGNPRRYTADFLGKAASARYAITLGSFTHHRRPPKIVGMQWVGADVRSIRICFGVIDRPVRMRSCPKRVERYSTLAAHRGLSDSASP